jgi:hypothetical protein
MAGSLKLNYNDSIDMAYIIFASYNWRITRAVIVVLFAKRWFDVVCVKT